MCRRIWESDGVFHVFEDVSSPETDILNVTTKNLVFDKTTENVIQTGFDSFADDYSTANIIVVTNSPLSITNAKILKTFDKVLITKTSVTDKQSQYHTTFVDPVKCDFKTFKRHLKNLAKNEYLTVNTVNREVGLPFSTIESEAKVKATTTTHVEDAKNARKSNPECHPVCPVDALEVWVCLFDPLKTSVEPKENPSTTFQAYLENAILQSMIVHTTVDEITSSNGATTHYFQIRKTRQDLFTALVMNILRALRHTGKIRSGCIFA
jgi:hypothetical protein